MGSKSGKSKTNERDIHELRRSEERLRDFAEAASDWFFELDRELQFTYFSERYQEITGVSPAQVLGKTPEDALRHCRVPEEEYKWRGQLATMKAHRSWQDFTFTLIRDDGDRRVIRNSAKAIFDKNGEFDGYRGIGRDVTDRTAAESQLNSLLAAVPDAIITIDEDGIVASFSQAAVRLFGYPEDEVVGQNVKLLMPNPYRDEHDRYIDHYKATGEKKIIGIGREVEAQRKDGSVFPMHLSVNEMFVEGKRMFTGVVHDLTELKQAQSQSARMGEILDRSLNEIYVFDADTLKFVQVNFGARRNMGYSSKGFRNLTPVDIKPELSNNQFAELIEPLRSGNKELLVFKTVHQRKDGSTYPVEVHLQLMRNENPPVFIAIIQDITEIEHRESQHRQSQKMEAIGQLTGGIAHDFNNLLTVIVGNNELLADMIGDDETMRDLLDDATSAAEHGAQLTSQLLAFARQQPLDPQIINLNDVLQEMSDMLRRTLGETISFRTIFEAKLSNTLADPVQVHNALLNLAINARDAMPDGGELIIETSNADLDADAADARGDAEPGHYVRVSVRDTGVGMPPEIRSRILEPFFTTKGVGKGTGLGLSMVHGFAKQSGGFLEVYSEAGYGTAISFYLPRVIEDGTGNVEDDEHEPAATAKGETILVVEDDPRVRKITVKRLEHLGYQTIEAETGKQALEILAKPNEIDVVFTDMVMPGGMTGGELLEQVSRTYPTMKKLITSGYAEDGTIPNEGTRWLRKPYSIQEMAEAFQELLD